MDILERKVSQYFVMNTSDFFRGGSVGEEGWSS